MKKSANTSQVDAADQRRRFEEAARELGCDESEERFDEVLKKVAKQKPKGTDGRTGKESHKPDPTVE